MTVPAFGKTKEAAREAYASVMGSDAWTKASVGWVEGTKSD
jgi:hypothetical protein